MGQVIKTANGVGWVQAGSGVGPISSFAGGSPAGPVIGVMLIVRQVGPNVQYIQSGLTLAPNGGGSSGQFSGTPDIDEDSGHYVLFKSVFWGYFPSVPFPNRWLAPPGNGDFVGGLLASNVTAVSTQPDAANFDFEIWLQYADPSIPGDWSGSGPAPPDNIQYVESDELDEFDEPTGYKNETFTWDLPVEDLVGTIIQRDGVTIASLGPDAEGDPVTTYVDTVTPGIPYIYTFYFYYLNVSGISTPVVLPPITPDGDPPVVPDVEIDTDSGAVDSPLSLTLAFEWVSVMAFITDPSGIYGLIPNKTHDTLYNRAEETSVNVKIPDPFVKLGFLPEE